MPESTAEELIEAYAAAPETPETQEGEKPPEQDSPPVEGDEEAGPPAKQDATGEDDKNQVEDEPEPSAEQDAIEPPTSWSSEHKEAFKALPQEMQSLIAAREQEREAHLSARTRTVAEKERELSDMQAQVKEAQARHLAQLEALQSVTARLLPAEFSDIRTHADVMKMREEDPSRYARFQNFQETLAGAQSQQAELQQRQLVERLDREAQVLAEKVPEFKDTQKASAAINDMRKFAVESYGYTPEELSIIPDHRQVLVLRDAMAYRKMQAARLVAEAKKTALKPTPTIRASGTAKQSQKMSRDEFLAKANSLNGNVDGLADLIASEL
jgi:hypothetical protein